MQLPVYIKVKNLGQGLFESIPQGSTIGDSNSLTIEALEFAGITCDDVYFTCNGNTCTNTVKAIPLIKKETSSIRCTLTAPQIEDNVEKTYYITAYFDYNYDVYGQATVEVKP